MNNKLIAAAVSAALVACAASAVAADFGQKVEALAKSQSFALFGVLGTLGASSSTDLTGPQIDANPAALATVAPGLSVRVVSAAANLGANIDMMALWPNDTAPTHIIACNEQGAANIGLQRINIATGVAEDIVSSGLTSCDPVEITAWGTIVFGEENGANGRSFELINPLATTGVTITGSGAATTISGTDAANIAFRGALGQLSFEGVAVYPNGVTYYSDESRPGASGGNAGGSQFKFIPAVPYAGGGPITDLANSPLAAGTIYGLRIGRNGGNTDFGQGNEFGRGSWVLVGSSTSAVPLNLRALAITNKLTGYYRPEDQDIDQRALANGTVRFCGNNTGQDTTSTSANGDNHWGETFCITDGTVAQSLANTAIPEYQPLVFGNKDFAMMDNLAYQPGRGNWIINEDGDGITWSPQRNNDIFACLDDGADADILSDACVKVISINDLDAETTGGVFDATGKHYYVSVQHNSSGHGVILEINGWQ